MIIMNLIQIGKVIKRLRVERGYSQQDLAEKVGVTWEMISRYERGKSSPLQKILEISESLKVPAGIFFMESDSSSTEFHEASPTYHTNHMLVPLINSLPAQGESLTLAIQRTPYFFSPSLPAVHTYAKESLFALDILDGTTVSIDPSLPHKKGIFLCVLNQEVFEGNVYLTFHNGSYTIAPCNDKNKVGKVIAQVVEYIYIFS